MHRMSCHGNEQEILAPGSPELSPHQGVQPRKQDGATKNACQQCRKRKSKCSGDRPRCHPCSDRDLACTWDVTEGITRTADLKAKLLHATKRGDDLEQVVMDQMSRLTDALQRADDLEVLVEALQYALAPTKRPPCYLPDSVLEIPSRLWYEVSTTTKRRRWTA